MVLIMIEVKFV